MPKTIETIVYTFSELDSKAKEKAREWFRKASVSDTYYSEAVLEDAIAVAALMGLTITSKTIFWSGFWSQGDGASFSGQYNHIKGASKAILEYAPQDTRLYNIASHLESAGEMWLEITQGGHYSHEGTMDFEALDDNDAASVSKFNEAKEALRAFARWIYSELDKAYQFANSDESIDESMEANEYTFTADGKRFG